eukprot:TRINITY_DN101887_c0_g1_i1.p1 TRINITY_DN101887_c0_g1~~TRINITY_DN101887_c0_g1_i1.p1  ORF type:complete len:575 (-),score=36.09 TRINITY_DN101887_c0_g1_i1:468-2192(-)
MRSYGRRVSILVSFLCHGGLCFSSREQRVLSSLARKSRFSDSEPCDGGNDICWNSQHRSHEQCCNTTTHGPTGAGSCWNPHMGYTYKKCCCYSGPTFGAHRLQVKTQYLLTVFLADKGFAELSRGMDVAEFQRQVSKQFGLLPSSANGARGPARTAKILLAALKDVNLRSRRLREAFDLLLSPPDPIVTHMKSGWPVFGLFMILAKVTGKGAEATTSSGRRHHDEDQQSFCLRNCGSGAEEDWAESCAAACFAAAAKLPPEIHSKAKQLGDSTAAASSLLSDLLRRGQSALLTAGRSIAPDGNLFSMWESLHAIQSKQYLVGPCPEGSVHLKVDHDDPYKICWPRNIPPLHARRFYDAGRWTDCDALLPLLQASSAAKWGHNKLDVIDLGANMGFCTGYALSQGARVYAFEPVPEYSALVRGAFMPQIASGLLTLTTASVSNVSSADGRSITLDSSIKSDGPPAVLKMDIEGWEFEALLGAKALLRGRVVSVLFDLHCRILRERGIRPWAVVHLLLQQGFNVSVIIDHEQLFTRITSIQDLRAVEGARHLTKTLTMVALKPAVQQTEHAFGGGS